MTFPLSPEFPYLTIHNPDSFVKFAIRTFPAMTDEHRRSGILCNIAHRSHALNGNR